jgi:hypothetical protein
MKCFLQIIIFLVILFKAEAQENFIISKNDSIIKETVSNQWRSRHVYYSLRDTSLSRIKLLSILNTYPESAVEVVKYRKQKTAALIVIPIFLASTIAAALQADKKKDQPGTDFSKAPILFSISLGTLFGGMILSWNNHIHKAVKTYNKQF